MKEKDWLEEKFKENENRLRAVAYRILGGRAEADDALQEAWLKITSAKSGGVSNIAGWLTTVVARVCLDMLRARKVRSAPNLSQQVSAPDYKSRDPEQDLLLSDGLGPALVVVLETFAPAERVAFVLHDLFDLSFEEISPIVGKSEAAARQLASRARRRVRGGGGQGQDKSAAEKSKIISAFLKASREGDFTALLQLLDPEIILRADEAAVKISNANKSKCAPAFDKEMRGAEIIAELFKGKAVAAQEALIDGDPGATWIGGGKPRIVFTFTLKDAKIAAIDIIMNGEDLDAMEVKPKEEAK